MTYKEFYHLQVGDIIEIHSKESMLFINPCVFIILNKECTRIESKVVHHAYGYEYLCECIHPNEFYLPKDYIDNKINIIENSDRLSFAYHLLRRDGIGIDFTNTYSLDILKKL